MRTHCARGEVENRLEECQLDLFAVRLSTETFRGKQLRLWWASAACVLGHTARRIGLAGTTLAPACATTMHLRLLKIGAAVTVSVRRVKLAMSSACPNQREFIAGCHALNAAARQAASTKQRPSRAIRPHHRPRRPGLLVLQARNDAMRERAHGRADTSPRRPFVRALGADYTAGTGRRANRRNPVTGRRIRIIERASAAIRAGVLP